MIEKYVTSVVQQVVQQTTTSLIQYFQSYYQHQIDVFIGCVSVAIGLAIFYLMVE